MHIFIIKASNRGFFTFIKEIDQQSKAVGFNPKALDQTARQGFANAQFEVNSEEGLELVKEFYTDENSEAMTEQLDLKTKVRAKSNQGEGLVQDIQQGLQRPVQALN